MLLRSMLALVLLVFVFASGAECLPQNPQDFLKRASILSSPDPDLAQAVSSKYRIQNYGYIPGAPYQDMNSQSAFAQIVETKFLGASANVHFKIVPALKCVEEEIYKNCDVTSYVLGYLSTFRARNTYRGKEISNHMFGLAVDIDPDVNPCCGCVDPWPNHPACQRDVSSPYELTKLPRCYIETFERYGFYWLGHDPVIRDTMHFEFLGRPELIAPPSQTECPDDMIRIERDNQSFCIDRFEAPNIQGAKPFTARTALEGQAWCEAQAKELCSDVMWEQTCQGEDLQPFPYGMQYRPGVCNDDKIWRVPNWSLIAKFDPANPEKNPDALKHVMQLNQSERSGERQQCQSQDGVFDLTGNVAEWVVNTKRRGSSTDGKINPFVMKGCYWSKCLHGKPPSCAFTNPNHAASFRSYEAGFRCCKKLAH